MQHKVLIEWNKSFTGGRVVKIETDDWDGDGVKQLEKIMETLKPEPFEKMIADKERCKKWKQSIEYKTRYVLLGQLEEWFKLYYMYIIWLENKRLMPVKMGKSKLKD